MQAFNLSPGITPLITEIAIVGFIFTLGIASFIFPEKRPKPIFLVLGCDSLLMSSFKIYTDYHDPGDLVLSIAVAVSGSLLIAIGVASNKIAKGSGNISWGAYTSAFLSIGLGTFKIATDFYDPFDVTLALAGVLSGLLILTQFLNGNWQG